MKSRILIVEDTDLIARSVDYALRREGFDTEIAETGRAALAAVDQRPPDLILLDLILPGSISGMDVCRDVRRRSVVPILVVSVRDSETDKVVALEAGADDYVVKPVSLPELVGRIHAHLRRVEFDQAGTEPTRRIGRLELDLARRRVSLAGEDVRVTPSEFDLLALLSEAPERVYSREEIVGRLWGSDFVGDTRSCDAHVARIRRKIERNPRHPERLVSLRGVGYRLQPAPDD